MSFPALIIMTYPQIYMSLLDFQFKNFDFFLKISVFGQKKRLGHSYQDRSKSQ